MTALYADRLWTDEVLLSSLYFSSNAEPGLR
jgi:hypothetical protein